MPARNTLALTAPGLAVAAAIVCLLRVLFDLPRVLDAGFGSSISFWAPLLSALIGGALAVVTAGAAAASVARPSAWTQAAAALSAGALAGYFGPDVAQRFVLLVAASGFSGILSLFWSLVGSGLAVAAALAALARLAQLLAGAGTTPTAGVGGASGAPGSATVGGWAAPGAGAASAPGGWGSGGAAPGGPAWGPGGDR